MNSSRQDNRGNRCGDARVCRCRVSVDWTRRVAQTHSTLSRRIEAAAKREREAGAGAEQICGEIGEIVGRESAIAELKRENERIIVDAQRYIETVSGKYGRLVKKLRSENARLREALKYMLEVNREDCDCLSDFAIRCMNAVNKTTRIYREGCDK